MLLQCFFGKTNTVDLILKTVFLEPLHTEPSKTGILLATPSKPVIIFLVQALSDKEGFHAVIQLFNTAISSRLQVEYIVVIIQAACFLPLFSIKQKVNILCISFMICSFLFLEQNRKEMKMCHSIYIFQQSKSIWLKNINYSLLLASIMYNLAVELLTTKNVVRVLAG